MTELLTLDDVAARLQVSRRTVERHVSERRLRVVHLGYRTRRVRPADLEAFIRSCESRRRTA